MSIGEWWPGIGEQVVFVDGVRHTFTEIAYRLNISLGTVYKRTRKRPAWTPWEIAYTPPGTIPDRIKEERPRQTRRKRKGYVGGTTGITTVYALTHPWRSTS